MEKLLRNIQGGKCALWCPACNSAHVFDWGRWSLSGTFEKPTLRPSLNVKLSEILPFAPKETPDDNPYMVPVSTKENCHFYITEGCIQYMKDCSHELAGKTVNMIPF